jgi:hypothetical protein
MQAADKDDLRWVKNARRRNDARDRKLPLLAWAGVADQVIPTETPAERKAYIEAVVEGFEEHKELMRQRHIKVLAAYREWVEDLGEDPDALLQSSWLVRCRKPLDGDYAVNHLNNWIAERIGATPIEVFDRVHQDVEGPNNE